MSSGATIRSHPYAFTPTMRSLKGLSGRNLPFYAIMHKFYHIATALSRLISRNFAPNLKGALRFAVLPEVISFGRPEP